MGISKSMTGAPWHKERMHRAEGDERRYKGRCEHYRYRDDYCAKCWIKCTGSAHCKHYVAISEEAFKERQAENRKKEAYSRSSSLPQISQEKKPAAARVGQIVFHKAYGEGEIVSIINGGTIIVVKFENGDIRRALYHDEIKKGILKTK